MKKGHRFKNSVLFRLFCCKTLALMAVYLFFRRFLGWYRVKHRRSFLYILFRRSGAPPYDTLLYTSPPSGSTPFSASSSATVTNRYPCCCK